MKRYIFIVFLVLIGVLCSLHCLGVPQSRIAQAKVSGETLTFFYDYSALARPGSEKFTIKNEYTSEPDWVTNYGTQIKKVVFEPSFSDYMPVSTAFWFCNLSSLVSVEGMKNLNTENVISMKYMFSGCSSLTELDLSGFHTEKVELMDGMFSNCTKIKTIYASEGWCVDNLQILMGYSSAGYMFYGCNSIVGGKGTTYTSVSRGLDYVFAHIDGGNENPGYFTDKGSSEEYDVPIPYAVFNNETLSFYYDSNKDNREGKCYSIEDEYFVMTGTHPKSATKDNLPGWYADRKSIKHAVVDDSFKDYLPVSLGRWFGGCTELLDVQNLHNINTSNVVSMYEMFDSCMCLTSLDLSGFQTEKVRYMNSMFGCCKKLTYINLENFNTSKVVWMAHMFAYCTSLLTVDVSNFDTSNVTLMEYMFSNCHNLKSLDLSMFNTSKVIDMSHMFWNCRNLEDLNISGFNTSNATNLEAMFLSCEKLERINIPNFYTSKAIDLSYLFGNCYQLKYIDLSKFNTSNVKNMCSMFLACHSLLKVDVSIFNTSNVTDMSSMFSNCTSLQTIDVNKFNTKNVKSMDRMFAGCIGIKTLNLRSFDTSKVTDIDGMFKGCSSLKTIYVTPIWSIKNVSDGYIVFDGCYELVGGKGTRFDENHLNYDYAVIDEGANNPGYLTYLAPGEKEAYTVVENNRLTFYYDENREERSGDSFLILDSYSFDKESENVDDISNIVTERNLPGWCKHSEITKAVFEKSFLDYYPVSTAYWFAYLVNLQDISNFSSLNTAKVTNMEGMFEYCKSLIILSLNTFNTSNVTSMKRMFAFCESLSQLNISNFNTSKVTDMSLMFHGCTSIPSINLKNFNTANVTTMCSMFNNNNKLQSLDLSTFNTANVSDMSQMFIHCTALADLNVLNFDTRNVTKMNGMFEGLGAEVLDLSSFNTIKVEDMNQMFYKCETLKTIYVSEAWTTKNLRTGRNMFVDCYNIVGGKGTIYNPLLNDDYLYAHIDGGVSNPGYLTFKSSLGIAGINATEENHILLYNIQGVRESNIRKGIYIWNGKKIVVK